MVVLLFGIHSYCFIDQLIQLKYNINTNLHAWPIML